MRKSPLIVTISGDPLSGKTSAINSLVEKYEKDHFVNITVPKKVIKQLKRKDNNVDDLYKLDSNLKILSNTLNDNYDKNKNNKNSGDDKRQKKFLNKKRKHK